MKVHNPQNVDPKHLPDNHRFMYVEEVGECVKNNASENAHIRCWIGVGWDDDSGKGYVGTSLFLTYCVPEDFKLTGVKYDSEHTSFTVNQFKEWVLAAEKTHEESWNGSYYVYSISQAPYQVPAIPHSFKQLIAASLSGARSTVVDWARSN